MFCRHETEGDVATKLRTAAGWGTGADVRGTSTSEGWGNLGVNCFTFSRHDPRSEVTTISQRSEDKPKAMFATKLRTAAGWGTGADVRGMSTSEGWEPKAMLATKS